MSSNNLYQTIPTLYKQWTISLDIMPLGIVEDWSSILHVGIGGNDAEYGDRTPSIMFLPSDGMHPPKLHISSAIDGNSNYDFEVYNNHNAALPFYEWTHVEMSQLLRPDESYQFIIRIAGQTVAKLTNTDPREFSDVKVFASDMYYTPAKARIHNLTIQTFSDDGELV